MVARLMPGSRYGHRQAGGGAFLRGDAGCGGGGDWRRPRRRLRPHGPQIVVRRRGVSQLRRQERSRSSPACTLRLHRAIWACPHGGAPGAGRRDPQPRRPQASPVSVHRAWGGEMASGERPNAQSPPCRRYCMINVWRSLDMETPVLQRPLAVRTPRAPDTRSMQLSNSRLHSTLCCSRLTEPLEQPQQPHPAPLSLE